MILSHRILQRRFLHFNVSCMSVNNRFQAFDPNRPGVKPALEKWTDEYSDCKDAKTTSAWTSINVTCQWNSPDIFKAHNPWPGHFLAETHGFPSHHILAGPIGPIGHASFVSGWRCLATRYSSWMFLAVPNYPQLRLGARDSAGRGGGQFLCSATGWWTSPRNHGMIVSPCFTKHMTQRSLNILVVLSGKLTVFSWKWPFIVDLPIQNGDFP
jgi:hypothetical protein